MSLPDLQVLKETIPAKARRLIYASWVSLVVLDGAIAAAYAALPATLPPALVVAAAVLLYLGIPVGTLAAVNVPTQLPPAGGGGTTVILSSDPEAIAATATAKARKAGPLVRRSLALVVAMVAGLVLTIANLTPASAAVIQYNATFTPGVTDGPLNKQLAGSLHLRQGKPGWNVEVSGKLTGLAPNSLFVAVPYKDGGCTPLPGVTAFPSGVFFTDSAGKVTVAVTVNAKSINPAGTFNVTDTHSVSVRRVVIQGTVLPGQPTGVPAVPNVPNLAIVEGCDRKPTRA